LSSVTSLIAARKAHISDLNDRGLCPAGYPKHDNNSMFLSSSASTKPIDPFNGIAPPSVAINTFFVDFK
jgi:hypothetical protein